MILNLALTQNGHLVLLKGWPLVRGTLYTIIRGLLSEIVALYIRDGL